ncbi:MAG: hypothetical protein DRQ55_06545 [Planctomycetota bacterium]|nr:MAG: hypothetical protein DRQ55_06545 [Planctomycetota bacterium]
MSVRALLTTLLLLTSLGSLRAQDDGAPLIVKQSGSQYMFVDENDPDVGVLVILGGVEIEKGPRRLLGDRMVLLIDTSVDAGGDADGQGGQLIPNARLLEVFVDGDVVVEEGDEQVAGAEAVHIDNRTGLLTLLDGSWRSGMRGQPMLVRFEIMRQFTGGRREVEGAEFTTCDYAHAHWGLSTPWALVEPTEAGRILKTSRSVAQVGDVPLVPLPGFHMNLDRARPPLRSVSFGDSSRMGFKVETKWADDASAAATEMGSWFGAGPVEAEWGLELDSYSKRGLFTEPSLTYRSETSHGRIRGSYIKDSKSKDHLDQPVEDSTRGRFDIEHRTRIDEHQTVDVELSYLSDRGYQQEYYESEFRTEKQQESYINYRHVEDNVAWSVMARSRLNDFDTQVEYLPQVERRVVAETHQGGWWDGINVSGREFVSNARLLRGDPPSGTASPPAGSQHDSSLRVGSRRIATLPFDVGGDRLTVSAGYDLTGFSRSAEADPTAPNGFNSKGGSVGRYALFGGASWSQTYSGVESDYSSERWNFDGVRQIFEPQVAFNSVLELNERPEDLIAIDNVEALDKLQVFTVGMRHRVQTHQRGQVVTVLDSQIVMPLFSNQDRDNDGKTMGDATFDTQWKPGAELWGLREATLALRLTVDPNSSWSYTKSYASYTTRFADKGTFMVSEDKARHSNHFVTAGLQWELTPKWTGAFFIQEDLRAKEGVRRGVLLRQKAHRWLIDIELSQRRADSVVDGSSNPEEQISFRFKPAVFDDEEQSLLHRISSVYR